MLKRLSRRRRNNDEPASPRRSGMNPETSLRHRDIPRKHETTLTKDATSPFENAAATPSENSVADSSTATPTMGVLYETVDAEDLKKFNAALESRAETGEKTETRATEPPVENIDGSSGERHETAEKTVARRCSISDLYVSDVSFSDSDDEVVKRIKKPPKSLPPSKNAKSPLSNINKKLCAFYIDKANKLAEESKWAEAFEMTDQAIELGDHKALKIKAGILARQFTSVMTETKNAIKRRDFKEASRLLKTLRETDPTPKEIHSIQWYWLAVERKGMQEQALADLYTGGEVRLNRAKDLLRMLKSIKSPLTEASTPLRGDPSDAFGRKWVLDHIDLWHWEDGAAGADDRLVLVANGAIPAQQPPDEIVTETLVLARDFAAQLVQDTEYDRAQAMLEVIVDAIMFDEELELSSLTSTDIEMIRYPIQYDKLRKGPLPRYPIEPVSLSSHFTTCSTCRGPARRIVKLLDSIYQKILSKADFSRDHGVSSLYYFKMRELKKRTSQVYYDVPQVHYEMQFNYALLEATSHLRAGQWSNAEYLLQQDIPDKNFEPTVWQKGMSELRKAQLWFWRTDKQHNPETAVTFAEQAVHTLGSVTPEPMQLNEAVALTANIWRKMGVMHKSEAFESLLPNGKNTTLYGSIVLTFETTASLLRHSISIDNRTLTTSIRDLEGSKSLKKLTPEQLMPIIVDGIIVRNTELLTILLAGSYVRALSIESKNKVLVSAAEFGGLEVFRLLVYAGLLPKWRRDNHCLAIVSAALKGQDAEMCRYIISDKRYPPRDAYLLVLAMSYDSLEVCDMLLDDSVYVIGDLDVEIKRRMYQDKVWSTSFDTFTKYLRHEDIYTGTLDFFPDRLIQFAILKGFKGLALKLLEKGASATSPSSSGKLTTFEWAVWSGDEELMCALLDRGAKATPFCITLAKRKGHDRRIMKLIQKKAPDVGPYWKTLF